jgi:chitinase
MTKRFFTLVAIGLISATAFFGYFRPAPENPKRQSPFKQWSLGYWTPQSGKPIPPSEIEWKALTHIVYWAALANPDGSLDTTTQQFSKYGPSLIQAAQAEQVKVLLGVSQAFWKGEKTNLRAASANASGNLINSIMAIVDTMGFDGVDLDWEPFDTSLDKQPAIDLVTALRQRLGRGRILTAAAIITDSAFWAPLVPQLDQLHIMTYDMTGPWMRYSWHNSALYGSGSGWSVDLAVKRFTAAGADASKLSIGIPFFGYRIAGSGIYQPNQFWIQTPSFQQMTYQSLHSLIQPTPYRWDDQAKAPYLSFDRAGTANDEFYTYEDRDSLIAKIEYAKANGLGGWFVWEIGGDYLPSQNPKQPLLNTISQIRNPQ